MDSFVREFKLREPRVTGDAALPLSADERFYQRYPAAARIRLDVYGR
jgi:hypothetical protein